MEEECVVALLSDTHGLLDEQTLSTLKKGNAELVLHAGDVGDAKKKNRATASRVVETLASELRCRVVAVAGNVDEGVTDLPGYTTVTILGKKILVIHACYFPPKTVPDTRKIIDAEAPDIVVFGHSHVPGVLYHDNILYVNPGSAGPKRFKLPRSVAFLTINHLGAFHVGFKTVTGDAEEAKKLPEDLIVDPGSPDERPISSKRHQADEPGTLRKKRSRSSSMEADDDA